MTLELLAIVVPASAVTFVAGVIVGEWGAERRAKKKAERNALTAVTIALDGRRIARAYADVGNTAPSAEDADRLAAVALLRGLKK